jgi:hypothetical protein
LVIGKGQMRPASKTMRPQKFSHPHTRLVIQACATKVPQELAYDDF